MFLVEPNPCSTNNPNYALIGGQCYYFDTNQRTRAEAKSYCTSNHGKLWEPKTIKRMNELHTKANSLLANKNWWIGINDTDSEGTYKFDSNGDNFPFLDKKFPWGLVEPQGGSSENCVLMNYKNNPLEFADVKCTRQHMSICESTSIPTGNITIAKIVVNIYIFTYYLPTY